MKEIKTRHLILWRGTEYEVDAFMKMLRDEGDFELFTGIEYSEAGMKEFEECFKWRHQNYTPGKRFFIFRKEDLDHIIGYVDIQIECKWPDSKVKIELEIYISAKFRRKGYGSEVAREMLWQLFEHETWVQNKQMFARTLSDNYAAINFLKKLGFQKVDEDYAAFISRFVDWSDSCQKPVSEYRLDWEQEIGWKKEENKRLWKSQRKIMYAESWFRHKEELRKYLQTHEQMEYAKDYIDLLKVLIQIVINPDEEERPLKIEQIIEIDKGCYGGEKVWLIPQEEEPDVRDFIVTYMAYGTCSGCDLLEGIISNSDMVTDFANEKQINDYMLLALHLLQRMRRLLSVEDFELDERFTRALYRGKEEAMLKQLEEIAGN